MRAAQLDENNTVINYAEVSGFDGVTFVDPLDSEIGSKWNGEIFSPPAVDTEKKKSEIQSEIDSLERMSMMNRGVRELSLRIMEERAAQLAASMTDGTTADQLLAEVPAYVKFKALDDQIAALRVQIQALGG